jgi:puromycin-sensitive aminopeptidase
MADQSPAAPAYPFRLVDAYIPSDYVLSLIPNIPAKTFTGTESLTFVKYADSEFADLFADKTIHISSVTQGDQALRYTHEDNRLRIFGDSLASGTVVISYVGSLDQKSFGWYWITDRCCSTHFEATHARAAFPCFDEPSFKATFKISITVPKDLTAISNMPAEAIWTEDAVKHFEFHRSPPMCTYLLAFAVGDFELVSGFTKRGVPIDVFALPGKKDLMLYPLDEAIKATEWYEDFFKVNYALPRLQLLAVPELQSGGMENFGLIIFREECLLGKAGVTSIFLLRWIAETVAHEIAHQWSGNAVSPKFWDSLWLNEGFASIMPCLVFADIHPDWKWWEEFQKSSFKTALLADDSDFTHPIHHAVESEGAIEGLFDDISYSKAACVIRMLMAKIGKNAFQRCLHEFFTEFLNKCADTTDLCTVFGRVLGVDMIPFFDAWTKQCNYPMVILEDDGTLHQKRFSQSGLYEDRHWPIPLVISYSKNDEVQEKMIELGAEPVKLDLDCDWLKLNKDCTSLCRVWQKGRFFTSLLAAIQAQKVSAGDKWALLVDYKALAQIGQISYVDVIKLVQNYGNETDPLVTSEVAMTLAGLVRLFEASRPKLEVFVRQVLVKILDGIGMEPRDGEPVAAKELRARLLGSLVFAAPDQRVIDYLVGLWEKFKTDRSAVDPDLVLVILRVAAKFGNAFDVILDLSRNDPNPEVKSQAGLALGYSPVDKLDQVLEIGLNAQLQDVVWYLAGVAVNPDAGTKMWDFLLANWARIEDMFKTMSFNIPSLIEHGAGTLDSEEQVLHMLEFFRQHPLDIAERPVKQAAEAVRNKIAIKKRDGQAIADFLASLD